MRSVAIVGAGLSGLAAAHTLLDVDNTDNSYSVTLFEKSNEVGGRAATRTRAGFIYDHGAQYIKEGTPLSLSLITERFRAPDLIDIQKPIWIFDGDGHIQEGDQKQNQEQKLNYRSGLVTLACQMAKGLSIQLETRIKRVQRIPTGWQLFDDAGTEYGPFDSLLITLPAPQASQLIQRSQLDQALQSSIIQQLGAARYNPLISVILGYQVQPRVRPYYALVNTDKQHAISWLAWEHEKSPERVPPGAGLLLVQMAPAYSKQHMETAALTVIEDVERQVSTLLQEDLPEPVFTDLQHWRYALPAEKADAQTLNALTLPQGLAFCGDAFVGGRLHLALEHGIAVSQQLIATHR
ncbi:NAD(P)/FAD-dependent oxidoreductase [Dictyobacter arantiisoli]|uniref:FAD-dependent oxidoreductase n=1 Tax=Dictyobacter arantiisoli TaxID=2014874 RepID=A0A5A5T9T1_9CHLR|nr:FAD-dependent oxidoreductase [Dictyobacter arantiisoli]GCF07664.1 FAD-dependent oxidoreductase [Dictyobacter arantiisoli]